jgi:cytochrome b subunit of formate dehydrogenase
MGLYKESPHIDVKFLDVETNEVILTVPRRTHLDIGEIFSENTINRLIMNKYPKTWEKYKHVLVLASVNLYGD